MFKIRNIEPVIALPVEADLSQGSGCNIGSFGNGCGLQNFPKTPDCGSQAIASPLFTGLAPEQTGQNLAGMKTVTKKGEVAE
jgi:hypothetical protein